MKFIAALAATCLIAGPAFAQTDTPAPAEPAPETDQAGDKPTPTIQAQRGAAPEADASADKPAEPAAETEASAPAADKPQAS